jgi:hypothetical protein
MSKEYNLYCPKHGHLKIEVEKPPTISKNVYCPWCAQRLAQPDKDAKEEWQPNFVGEGAKA